MAARRSQVGTTITHTKNPEKTKPAADLTGLRLTEEQIKRILRSRQGKKAK